jgi:hypothetical protein
VSEGFYFLSTGKVKKKIPAESALAPRTQLRVRGLVSAVCTFELVQQAK